MAAEKQVVVRVRAEISAFTRDMAVAASAARKAAKETEEAGTKARSGIGKLSETANAHEKAWGQVSTGLIAGGVAIAGGLTLATKAAMDWESEWTGVLKTVDGSPSQLRAVEEGLRGLAKTLPSTHTEIAGVAESAGQLGVATKDVVGFTKTMIDLGESTNLTADDAATNIAQISNVMGTMKREGVEGVQRFGAALVALGNDGASTEAEILSMAQRIAGAGATIGASESDVLALSNTLASMGVKAELGGGVTTRVLLKMYSAVQEGGETLDSFAATAGMSAEQFSEAFRTSPVEALDAVNKGLFRVKEEGGNVVATMKDLGIKGTEETQVMLALAASGNLLSDSLALGNKAWAENTALVDEANKRYETSSSKIKIAWNNMKDSAIDAGAVILPAIAALADGAAKLASVFGDLPKPVQVFLVAGAGIVGLTALAAGGFMKMTSSIMTTVGGLKALSAAAPGATAAIGTLARTAGLLGIFAMIGPTIAAMVPSGATAEADAMTDALKRMGSGGDEAKNGLADLDKMFTGKGGFMSGLDVKGLEDAFKVIGNRDVSDNIDLILSKTLSLGTRGSSNIEFAKKNFEQLDAQLAQMSTNGNAEGAANAYEMIAAAAKNADVDQKVLTEHFPEYTKALGESSAELEKAAVASQMLGTAMGVSYPVTKEMAEGLAAIGVSADGSVTAMDKLLATLFQLSDGTLNVRAANRAVEDTFRSMTETIKKNGKSLDESTAKGSENQANLDAYIGTLKNRTTAIATAVDENGDLVHSDKEVQDSMTKSYEQAIKAAGKFGVFGKEAEALARELLGIPKDVNIKTWLEDFATDRANQITGALDAMPEMKNVKVIITDEGTIELKKGQLESIKDRTVSATVTDEGTILEVQGGINNVKGKTEYLLVSDDGTVTLVQGKINGVKDGSATVNVGSSGIPAVDSAINNAARDRKSTVTVGWSVLAPPSSIATTKQKMFNPGGNMHGGQLPRNSAGSRLPTTGPGTEKRDGFLGLKRDGTPLSWLDGGEWIINRDSSEEHDWLLRDVNRNASWLKGLRGLRDLGGLAKGGRVGWSQGQDKNLQSAAAQATAARKQAERDLKDAERGVSRAASAYSKIDGKKANKGAKASAKRESDAAKRLVKNEKAALDRLKKAEDAAKKKLQDSKARTARLGENVFDLRRDLKRGSITDAFTSGSGMSIVDRMFDQSNNKDLSKKQRGALRSTAYRMESELLRLEKQADKLSTSLDKAKSSRDDLLSVQKGTQSSITGAFDLGGLFGQKDAFGYQTSVGKKGLLSYGKSMAGGAKKLSSKVASLQKLGFNAALIEQVIGEWTSAGTFELADAMLSMNKSERNSFNNSFKSVERYGLSTGTSLTNAMSKGGINAAEGLVKGLESQSKKVDNAFYKLGKDAEKSFKRSLGIKSPSKNAMGWMSDVVDGSVIGVDQNTSKLESAMFGLGKAGENAFQMQPAFSIPPSSEVARYAAQPAASTVSLSPADRQLMQDFIVASQNMPDMKLLIDGRQAGTIVNAGNKYARNNT